MLGYHPTGGMLCMLGADASTRQIAIYYDQKECIQRYFLEAAMKKKRFLARVAACGPLVLGIGLGVTAGWCQVGRASPMGLRHQAVRSQPDAYTGRIAKRRGSCCVLINTNSGTIYQLDDQHKAQRYLGKGVIVIGTRQLMRNLIHVYEIRFNKSS